MTKKEVNAIIENTKKELKGKQMPICRTLGYFQKAGANWRYIAGWTCEGDLVVTVFGKVQ